MSLFDQIRAERDACGIGFVADARGRASRRILDAALEGLANVRHRAPSQRTVARATARRPASDPAGSPPGRGEGSRRCSSACRRAHGDRGGVLRRGDRDGGLADGAGRADALGESARATMPRVEQLVLLRPFGADRRGGAACVPRAGARA